MAGGAVWVPVNASAKGMVAQIVKEASGAAKQAGASLEKGLGDGGKKGGDAAAKGFADQAKQIERVSARLGQAREAEAGASAKVTAAEAKLAQLRQSGTASASQIARAEQQLETAKNQQSDASARVAREERDLASVRDGGQATSVALARAEDNLAKAKTDAATASGKLKTAEAGLGEAKAAQEAASSKVTAAEQKLSDARSKFGAKSKEAAAAEKELESAKKQADSAGVKVAKTEGDLVKARADLTTKTEQVAAKTTTYEATQKDLAAAQKEVADSGDKQVGLFDRLGGSMGEMAKMAGTAVAGYLSFSAVKGVLYDVGAAFDDAYDTIRVGTGASGEAFDGLKESMKTVATESIGVGSDISEIGTTLADLNTRLGVTGEPLEQLTAQFQQLKGLGVDADINEISAAFNQFGVEASEMPGMMDQLFRISQATGLSMTDLTASLSKSGPALQGFGFGLTESAGLLGALDKAGLDSEKTLGSMTKALGEFAKEGKNPQEALWGTITKIDELTAAGKNAEAIDLANSIFGARGGAGFVAAVESGTFAYDDFMDSIGASGDTIGGVAGETADFAEQWDQFKMRAMYAIEPVASALFGLLGPALESLGGFMGTAATKAQEFGDFLSRNKTTITGLLVPVGALVAGMVAYNIQQSIAAAGGIVGMFSKLGKAIKGASVAQWAFNGAMWANPLTWIVAAIVAVVAGLVWFFTQTEMGREAWAKFTEFLGEAWGNITQWATDTWARITEVWQGLPEWFGEKWQAVKDKVSEVWESIKTTITEKWTAITTWFATAWEAYKAQVSANWEAVKAIFTGVWEAIWGIVTGVWTRISTWITNAWSLFQAYVNLVWTAVKMIFTGQWGAIQQLIVNVWNYIQAWITGKWQAFQAYVGVVWNAIKQTFQEVWDSIKQKIQDTWDAINTAVAEAVANVIAKMQEFVNGIRQKVDEALGKLREFPGQVKSLFADAGRWLINAGRNIINGLWEGMKNAWSNVKGWLSDNLSFSAIGSFIGLSGGGIVMADGGVINQYAAGGIDQVEQYANGGRRGERHVAQIAPAGAWRVWAEPETGGEAYIPLSPRKRARSTAILDEVAARFGYTLVDGQGRPYSGGYSGDLGPQHVTNFADGGVVTGDDLLSFVGGSDVGYGAPSRPLHGAPYDWGGVNWGDCSGAVSAVANTAVGMRSFGSRFATANEASELSRMGFSRGRGGDGDLRIGFKNGGPAGGHTAGTLPDGTNFEMGGAANQGSVGARAAGAWDSYFNEFFYLPIGPGFEKVELDDWGDLSADPSVPEGTAGNVTVTNSDPVVAPSTAAATESKETTISGQIGEIGKEAITGQVSDFLGVFGIPDTIPAWMTAGRDIKDAQSAGSATTSAAEESAIEQHDAAVTTMTPDEIAQNPQLSGIDNPDVINQPEVPEWGPEFFAYEIARQAKAMGLSKDGAKIGIATALVESGDPMKMYANNRVPESLKYRHDALGSDHDSVGLFQQRDNGAWGTVAQRMNAFESAGLFFRELVKFDWESMDPGAAAQKVQRSAFPDRYATKMDRAMQMVEGTGLYDQGGVLDDKHLALNLSGKPEAVLTNDQWKMVDQLGGNLPQLVGGAASSAVSGAVGAGAGALGGVANTIVPGSGAMIASAAGPIGELGGWYAGEVASGWTSAIMQASQQALDIAAAPLEDLGGVLSGPLAPVMDTARPILPSTSNDDAPAVIDNGGPGETIIIQVNTVDEALEAKRHLEARKLAGFGVTR